MKKQTGITLVSLAMYIIVMMIVLVVISAIAQRFYANMDDLHADTQEILQMSKINSFFLKEIKQPGNQIDTITENSILFKTGNSFSFHQGNLYFNQLVIGKNVKDFTIIEGSSPSIIKVIISFSNYTKTMTYKIESIN